MAAWAVVRAAIWSLLKEEMPAVQRFSTANPGVRVVGIAIDDSPDSAREFAREVGVTFPLAAAPLAVRIWLGGLSLLR